MSKMSKMTDYVGNEINIGDIILCVAKGASGYQASFAEAEVVYLNAPRGTVGVRSESTLHRRRGEVRRKNIINLTALGLRPRGDTNG